MQIENDELERLFKAALPAMERDVAQVSLGFQARVAASLRGTDREENGINQWANAFFQSALVSCSVIAALGLWAWVYADVGEIGGDWAISSLVEEPNWSTTRMLP